MSFENLEIAKPILNALESEGYKSPTAIQKQAIPVIFEGKDLLGCAQTGTGKTAAFAVPIIQKLSSGQNKTAGKIRALILSPTRELAGQIGESFSIYGKNNKLKNAVIYGGISQVRQTNKLSKGVDILVATPGRLLDLIGQGYINLKNIEIFVLDEADRMLDMGFINDIKKIINQLPKERQSLFFSATMSPEIIKLAETILNNPVRIEIENKTKTVDKIAQGVYFVSKSNKKNLLYHILVKQSVDSAIIFTRTKSGADRVSRQLNKSGINALAIHGDKSQNARQKALDDFKSRKVNILVATDIAARGIDIEELSHVINYEMPENPENYIHRIGRTGRAGLSGTALSFCDKEELSNLKEITKLIKMSIPIIKDHPYNTEFATDEKPAEKEKKRSTKKITPEVTAKGGTKKEKRAPKKKPDANETTKGQLEVKFPDVMPENNKPGQVNQGPEKSVETPDEINKSTVVQQPEKFNQQRSDNRNRYHNHKKPFHKKKKFSYESRQQHHGKKFHKQEQQNQQEKVKPVIDNRSTSELQSAQNLNRLASRNQAKFEKLNNSGERRVNKVWTNHEEFITIGYKKEKKYSNNGSSNNNSSNRFNKQGKNKSRQEPGNGGKSWSNYDRSGSGKFSPGKKKDSGFYGTSEGQGNQDKEQNQNKSSHNHHKKKFFGSNKNNWKK